MSQRIMTLSVRTFLSLLTYAPETLKNQVMEEAQRGISLLCFTEADIREKLAQEDGWDDLSVEEQREAVETLLDQGDYENAADVANRAIAEAAANYLADRLIEKSEAREEDGYEY